MEDRKCDKYRDLINDGCIFQSIAFEVHGVEGPSTDVSGKIL